METIEKQVFRLDPGDYYSAILEDGRLSLVFGFSSSSSLLLEETVSYAKDVLSIDKLKGKQYTVVVYRRETFLGKQCPVMYSRCIN